MNGGELDIPSECLHWEPGQPEPPTGTPAHREWAHSDEFGEPVSLLDDVIEQWEQTNRRHYPGRRKP